MAISRTLPPCHRTKNKAFIDPDHAKDFQVRAAQSMCGHCPLLKECAVNALGLGTVPGRDYSGPADAVIMAGVICRGDLPTAEALASIAGVAVPRIGRQSGRAYAPDVCRECSTPMVPWTRETDLIPAGFTVHHARGFCTGCRVAYRAHMETVTDRRETRAIEKCPSHCRGCNTPMVPMGNVPPAGHVEHLGRGMCHECGRPSNYTTTSRIDQTTSATEARAEALARVSPELWISYADASTHYGLSASSLYRYVRQGRVSTMQIPEHQRRSFLDRGELEAVLGVSTCARPPEVSVSECV